MPSRHNWLSWESYKAAHYRNLERFGHFILDNTLRYTLSQMLVDWEGVLFCEGGVEIHVRKTQDVQINGSSHLVRTDTYAYQVFRRHPNNAITHIVRYDNAHVHPGHPTRHHRHSFRPGGEEFIDHVGEDWPTLAEVIEEAEQWVADHPLAL